MLILALSLMATVAWGQDYEFVTATEIATTVKMETSEITEAPEGSIITWKPTARDLVLEVENTGTMVMQVDWNSSAFVDIDGVASGIVPGNSLRKDYTVVTAPTTIPPGSKIVEAIVRESAIHLADGTEADEALVERWAVGKDVAVTLALMIDGDTVYHTQRFSVGPDHEYLAILEEQRKKEKARKSAEILYQKRYDKFTAYRRNTWLFGGLMGGGGALMTVMSATDPEMRADDPYWLTTIGVGVVPMAIGIPLGIHFYKKAKQAKGKLPSKPVGYEPE